MKAAVEKAAQAVLEARAQLMDEPVAAVCDRRISETTPNERRSQTAATKKCTLADLYDPVAMPPSLSKAHAELDRTVDRCYRKEPFPSDRDRVEFLFQLYEKLTAPLIAAAKPKRGRKTAPAYAKPPSAPSHPDLTPEKSYGDSAHYYHGKEEPPPYRTG